MSKLGEDQLKTNSPPLSLANIGKIEISNIAEYEHSSSPWEIMAQPLDLKPFSYHIDYLITPSFMLYKEGFNSAIKVHGLTPDNMLGFSIPLKLGSQSLYWKEPHSSHKLPASLPGGLDVTVDAGQEHIIVLLELCLLERMLTKEQFTSLKHSASKHRFIVTEYALELFTQWLLNLLSDAQLQTVILQHTAVLRSVEEDLVQQLLSTVRLEFPASVRYSRLKRRAGFELALEYIREADLSSINVPELCSKTGISQRTLEYAFREHFDMTPVGFIKKLRLHSIQRKLLIADSSGETISNVAYNHGIYDLGRFASTYKNHFGELPSQTLIRPPVNYTKPYIL